jgi:ABC-type Zn uptake system ZnuABC Zn-binding protein ZnuA
MWVPAEVIAGNAHRFYAVNRIPYLRSHSIPVLTGSLLLAACAGSTSSDASSAPTATNLQAEATSQCQSATKVDGRPLKIATTVAPITNIVANIVGDKAEVIGIVPEGTNSHTFEPAASVAATLEKSDLVFINGLVLEEPTKELALANKQPTATICELGTSVISEAEYLYDFSFPKDGGKPNPHLWTDPTLALAYAEVIAATVTKADPANATTYATNLAAFTAKIGTFDAALKTATATVPAAQRKMLTYHDAYAYFAKTYGWEVIGAIQPSSFEEPTPKEVADLIEQVKASGVPAIFGSEVFPSPVLAQIGKEAGVTYVDELRDDDLPGEPGEPGHSWMGLMQFDYVTLVEALGGDASALKALDVNDVTVDSAKYPQ